MSSRIAQLAARLDALSRTRNPDEEVPRIVRAGFGLAIALPAAVIEALALHEGDRIELQVPEQGALLIVSRLDPAGPPAGG
jgi:hypothetical protein